MRLGWRMRLDRAYEEQCMQQDRNSSGLIPGKRQQ